MNRHILFLWLTLLAPPAIADQVACSAATMPGVICLTGPVSDMNDGPLLSGQVYHIVGNAHVPAGETLSVLDGAVVKVVASFRVDGTLSAGAAVFTSIHDDTFGGDTNGNGSATTPSRGDWTGLVLTDGADSSGLDGTTIRYGTQGVELQGADANIAESIIERCSLAGIDCGGSAFPSLARVRECNINNCGFAIDGVSFEGIERLTLNTAGEIDAGEYLRVTHGQVTAPVTQMRRVNSINDTGVFVIASGVSIPSGTLVDAIDVIFKMTRDLGSSVVFDVLGETRLIRVTFTSLADDQVGGDTNNDGNATSPQPNDWGQMRYTGPGTISSQVFMCLLRYGGGGSAVSQAALHLDSASFSLTSTVVSDWGGNGIDLNGNSFPNVQDCLFASCDPFPVAGIGLEQVGVFINNSAFDNALGDYMRIDSGGGTPLQSQVDLRTLNSLNGSGIFVLEVPVRLQASGQLSAEAGVVLKAADVTPPVGFRCEGGRLLIDDGPVVITALADDTVGGDTNKDGGATIPEPGAWGGIHFEPGPMSDASVLDQVTLRYGGSSVPAIRCVGSGPTLSNSIIELFAGAGLGLATTGFPIVSSTEFRDNGGVAVDGAPVKALSRFEGCTASGNAGGDHIRVTNGLVEPLESGSVAFGPQNSLSQTGVFEIADDLEVPAGTTLVIESGTILKFSGSRTVDVDGTLICRPGATSFFTGFDDDTIGGDTNVNGGATTPQPGDWVGMVFNAGADASTLEDVEVRWAGGLSSAVRLVLADVTLRDVRIKDSDSDALDLSGNSNPAVEGCQFEGSGGVAIDRVPIQALAGFTGNTASGNAGGNFPRVTVGSVANDLTLSGTQGIGGVIVLATNLTQLAGNTLTIDPGTIVKLAGNRTLTIHGSLAIDGSAQTPVVVTSFADDSAGGDTNGDGALTLPAPGDWSQLVFQGTSDASDVNGLEVRYGGGGNAGCVDMNFSNATLVALTVRDADGDAMDLGGQSRPIVEDSRFERCSGHAVDGVPLRAIAGFDRNTAADNGLGDYLRVTSMSLAGQEIEVERHNALDGDGVFVFTQSLLVLPGESLTMGQGTIVKWAGDRDLQVRGVANLAGTGSEPVVFTSLLDDAVGGDTNKDGAATLPAPGDWDSIDYTPFGAASVAEHVCVRYGGSSSPWSIGVDHPAVAINAIRASHSASDGIGLVRVADARVDNLLAHDNAGDGITLDGDAFDLAFATSANNGGVGIARAAAHAGILTSSIAFGNQGGETTGYVVGEVAFSNAGAPFAGGNGNIHADPLFMDPAAGDYTLDVGSPSLSGGDFVLALHVLADHDDASRITDEGLTGTALPDMGAYESAAWHLDFVGEPRTGTNMGFVVAGTTGAAIITIGPGGNEQFFDPYGVALNGVGGTAQLARVVRTGTMQEISIDSVGPIGTTFYVQAVVGPILGAPVGQFTNVWLGEVFD